MEGGVEGEGCRGVGVLGDLMLEAGVGDGVTDVARDERLRGNGRKEVTETLRYLIHIHDLDSLSDHCRP